MKSSTVAKMGAVISAATALAGVANAQMPSGISVRIGDFLPTSSIASDLSHSWFGFGADMKLSTLSASVPVVGTEAYFGISADYYAHGGDNDIPVALTYNIKQGPLTFAAGIGPDFRNSGDLTSTGVGIAEQASIRYDILKVGVPVFVEGKYFLSSKPELSGFGFYVGVTF